MFNCVLHIFTLTREQKKYCTTREESLAVVWFTCHFSHYLLGRPFDIRTDHSSLQYFMNFRNLNKQLARWLEELSQYCLNIYTTDKRTSIRMQMHFRELQMQIVVRITKMTLYMYQISCGGCDYCRRIHQNLSEFISDGDDTVPLISNNSSPKDHEVQCNFLEYEYTVKEMSICFWMSQQYKQCKPWIYKAVHR